MKYTDEKQFAAANIFGKGQPNDAYARYFAGHSFLNPLTKAGECPIAMSNVTFEPGCRNNCTAGEGWYQEAGKAAQSLTPGAVVYIPAGVKHWHGAKKDSWFAHIAFDVPGEDASNEWLEPVTDEEYNSL